MTPQQGIDAMEAMQNDVYYLLDRVGYRVDSEELKALLVENGGKEKSDGRISISPHMVHDFVDYQIEAEKARKKTTQTASNNDVETPRFGIGNMVAKYYDHEKSTAVPATIAHLRELAAFGEGEPRIASVSLPVSLSEKNRLLAPLIGVRELFASTSKARYHIDPFDPRVVPYLADLSQIILGPGRTAEFIDPCNCINPVMRLEHRTASVMIARAKYNANSLVTSMPALGGTGPVTVPGAVVQGTAEIVGGLVISYLLNPNANNRGYISSGVLDMKTGRVSQSAPESIRTDLGVVQLMEYGFGGNTGIGGWTYISSVRPGLGALWERMLKHLGYTLFFTRITGFGAGILDNGNLVSGQQIMLDLEIAEGLWNTAKTSGTDRQARNVIAAAARGDEQIISSPHTLRHFRDALWESGLFTTGSGDSEEQVLERAWCQYRERVQAGSSFQPSSNGLQAIEKVIHTAEQHLQE